MKKIIGFLLIASSAVYADLNSVSVPAGMIHSPDNSMGIGYSGKVEYTLTPLASDSVYVTLSIVPVGGGDPLTLTEVNGDVGVVHINTNKPNVSAKYEIFFQASAPQPGMQYVARIIADANISKVKTQVENLLSSMTKTQKAALFGGDGNMIALGAGPIPSIYTADGPAGVRLVYGGTTNSTCFPTCAGEAATWDTALAFALGQAKAEEFRACGKNCQLGPAGDLVYHPQGGRAGEYFGEDPFQSGRMMAADIMGVQTRGAMATIKHFACNNKESSRWTLSANMSERSLREIYLYNWQPGVVKAQSWALMGSYNKINGSYAATNKFLMSTVLRDEWGYKYLAFCDWDAYFDNLASGMNWGVDIQMAKPTVYSVSGVTGFSDSIVDVHARRIILSHAMIGDLAPGYNATAYKDRLMCTDHVKLVRTVGASGIILARNSGNILPLPKTGAKIAVTGPFRNQCRLGPGGSGLVIPPGNTQVNPLQGMRNILNGIAGASTIQDNNTAGADYIVVFVGVNGEAENGDRPNLAIQPNDGENDVQAALNITTAKTVVVFTGGSAACAGNWSKAGAIVIALYPGQEQGNSIADILFGNVNPGGKLPVTFPQDASQLPNFNLTNGNLVYPGSDTAHGYFRMDKRDVKPLFYFGHGLSYTTFTYSDLQIYPSQINAGDRIHARVTVKNAGTIAGKEVVQLYLSMPSNNSSLPVRVQDLRGFKKVSLDPGASATVDFTLTAEEMRVFNPNGADYNGSGFWTVLAGDYGVRIGTSADRSEQPSVSGKFTVK